MTQLEVFELSEIEWEEIKLDSLKTHSIAELSDELLVTGCVVGDEEFWRALLERYGGLIYNVAYSFGFPTIIAEEIFQDVCLQAIYKMHTVHDRSKIRAWLITVTKRLCMHHKRKMNRIVLASDSFEELFPADMLVEDTMLRSEAQLLIEQAIVELDDRCRYIIEALFLAAPSVSYDEVAEQLDIAKGSVGPIRQRCLNKLRDLVLEIDSDTSDQD